MKAELRQEWEPRLLLFADCHYPSALFSYQQSYCYQFRLIHHSNRSNRSGAQIYHGIFVALGPKGERSTFEYCCNNYR